MEKKKKGNPNTKKGVQPSWLKGKGFDANPGNINKKGPRRSIGSIIDNMAKDDAAEELDKKTLMKLYKVLFNTPKKELIKLNKREDTPLGVSIIIDTLLDEKTRAKAWHDYQQYVYGKATEEVKVRVSTGIDLDDMTPEELAALALLSKKVEDDY